jgi:hypothetical protein
MTASEAGLYPVPGLPLYAGAKAGVSNVLSPGRNGEDCVG